MGARLRVGLIGCGRIARVHRAYLQGLTSVELIGVCDVDAAARSAFATECGLPEFASVAELIERGRPDVAHVLTPPATHAPLALELLRAGVNVLVEKPLALSTAEADQVVAAARKAGCWVSVDHNRWFDPVVQQAATIVQGGCIGSVVGVEVFQGAEAGEADKHGDEATHPRGQHRCARVRPRGAVRSPGAAPLPGTAAGAIALVQRGLERAASG